MKVAEGSVEGAVGGTESLRLRQDRLLEPEQQVWGHRGGGASEEGLGFEADAATAPLPSHPPYTELH